MPESWRRRRATARSRATRRGNSSSARSTRSRTSGSSGYAWRKHNASWRRASDPGRLTGRPARASTSRRPASRRSNTVPPTGPLGVRVLDALHRLVVQAEVMTELVDDGFTHELRHLLLVDAVFLDRPLVDRHRVGEDVAVARVAAREIDAPVERVGRLDAQLGERRVLRPGLDDDRDVGELVLELPGQASERPVHQRLELPP